jgi:ABC-type nickel/cobalt efflux system permease component RcnA
MPLACRCRPGADELHRTVGNQQVTIVDDAIRQNHRPGEHFVEHHFSNSRPILGTLRFGLRPCPAP